MSAPADSLKKRKVEEMKIRLGVCPLIAVVIALAFMLTACSRVDDDSSFKDRVKMSNEYMSMLKQYNSFCIASNKSFRPFIDDRKQEGLSFDGKFWADYQTRKANTLEKSKALLSFSFKFSHFRPLKDDFAFLADRMEEYFGVIDETRHSTRYWDSGKKRALFAKLDPIYQTTLKKSGEVVHKIDEIYNQVFVVGQKK